MVFDSIRSLVILQILVLFIFGVARAERLDVEVPQITDNAQEVGVDSINRRIGEIKADPSIDEETRGRLIDLYESALNQLKAEESYKEQINNYRESALQSAKEIDEINRELNQTIDASKKITPDEYKNLPFDQMENQLFESRLRLESLKSNLEQLGRELKQQQNRPGQIRLDQQQIQDKLQELEEKQRRIPVSGDRSYKAQITALRATEKALRANLNSLQMELSSHPPRFQVLRARYELAIAKVATESARLETLEKLAVANRESEAARYSKELAEALEAASDKHPLIRESIQQNFELGKELRILSEDIAVAASRLDEIKEETRRVESESEDSEKKISLAGLSPTLAAILREQRRLLPSETKIDQIGEKLVAKTGQVTLRLFEIEEKQRSFLDLDRIVDEKFASTSPDDAQAKHQLLRVRVELGLLLEEQKSLLLKLNEGYSKYLNILGDIDFSKQRLAEVARGYAAFLDENLLWVKSSPPINEGFLWSLARTARWIISPDKWWETLTRLLMSVGSHKLMVAFGSTLILAVFGMRRLVKARLLTISELVGSVRTDRFRYTLDAIGLTILQVAPGVAVLYGAGWLLESQSITPEFARAAGRGMCAASIPFFILQSFYRILLPGGVAELHLKWRRTVVSALGSQTSWLRFVIVPCIFLITMTGSQSETEYSDSLGRLALIVAMIAISLALGKVLHPSKGVLKYFLADHITSLISRTRYFWYSLILLVPLVIAGFASAGYFASAIELQVKLVATIRIIFIALFVHQLALRGLRLFNRNLALKKLREKRLAEKTVKSAGEAGESLPAVEQDEIDISTIHSQTMRVLLTVIVFGALVGLWLLWEDVLPALAILNEWVLWHKSVVVDGVETLKPVAVSNLLVVILYILVAITATRNLPGVMEVLIMNRFSIDTGSRYAINQLIGYALIAVTIILVAAELGGQWSELQWLVAALGVGLGFGLQEIFANFISGIILLFERPIRIGDTVTVGNVSGTVSRIQIRATTITDWDRKDLVVPNKTFITDQLINWTRTDDITRMLIPIGIAYGSDTTLAHQVMSDIVSAHPLVLKEPAPTVFFVGFGDSALNFEIRIYVRELANRLPLTHDLHMQLNQALKEHGIEIPFPQHDIHLRSIVATSDSQVAATVPPVAQNRAGQAEERQN